MVWFHYWTMFPKIKKIVWSRYSIVLCSVPKCPLFTWYIVIKFPLNYESNNLMLQSFYGQTHWWIGKQNPIIKISNYRSLRVNLIFGISNIIDGVLLVVLISYAIFWFSVRPFNLFPFFSSIRHLCVCYSCIKLNF